MYSQQHSFCVLHHLNNLHLQVIRHCFLSVSIRTATGVPFLPDAGNSYSGTIATVAIFSLYWKCGPKSFRICSLIAPLPLHSAAGQVICFSPWFTNKHGEIVWGGTLILLSLEGHGKNLSQLPWGNVVYFFAQLTFVHRLCFSPTNHVVTIQFQTLNSNLSTSHVGKKSC